MQTVEIHVERRAQSGKGVARKLRAAGRVPGVFYGPGRAAVGIALDPHELSQALKAAGRNGMLKMVVPGDELDGQVVLLKDLQRDPVRRNTLHADLYEVRLDRAITVEVPIHLVGKAPGVETDGGTLDVVLREIEIRCLPDRIPTQIDVDVSQLEIGVSLHVGEIPFPEGVTPVSDGSLAIVTIAAPEGVAEPAAAAAEAAPAKPAGKKG